MRLSLVVGAVDRPEGLGRLLASLAAQHGTDLQVVVVDQSEGERLEPVILTYRHHLPLVHVRSPRGLARARNAGLAVADGDIVGFPDDDCWYPEGAAARVLAFFQAHPEWEGLTGRTLDAAGRPSAGRWGRRGGPLTPWNVWWRVVSTTLFLRRTAIERVGPFDETLGAGADTPWGSSEELDYVLRALAAGCRLYYEPTLVVVHPQHPPAEAPEAPARAFRYGAGVGRVLRKHRVPRWWAAYLVVRPLGGVVLSAVHGRPAGVRYYWAGFRGRVAGWRAPLARP